MINRIFLKTNIGSKGASLVELMISMALGAFILVSAMYSLHGTLMVDKSVSALAKLEETVRFASRVIRQDVEMAGFRGCADPATTPTNNTVVGFPLGSWILNFLGLQEGVTGWEVTASENWNRKGFSSGALPGAESATAGSDVIRIVRGSSETANLSNDMNWPDSPIEIDSSNLSLNTGDVAIISDCENVDIFKVSTASSTSINHQLDGGNSSNELSKPYAVEEGRVMEYLDITYFVADTNRDDPRGNDIYALFRKNFDNTVEELVEGVENLQVSYGQRLPGGHLRFLDADDTSLNFLQVESVRFSIIASAIYPSSEQNTIQRFFVETGTFIAGTGGGAEQIEYIADGRTRKTLTTSFSLRNRKAI